MRPVVRALAEENILVSVETYHPEVGVALLEAGAGVVNLTGRVDDPRLLRGHSPAHKAGIGAVLHAREKTPGPATICRRPRTSSIIS